MKLLDFFLFYTVVVIELTTIQCQINFPIYTLPSLTTTEKSWLSIDDKLKLVDKLANEADFAKLMQLKWERNKKLFMGPPKKSGKESAEVGMNYFTMVDYFHQLAKQSSRITLTEIGKTKHDLPIFAIKVAVKESWDKPVVVIESGLYANEFDHISVASTMVYFLIETNIWTYFKVDWIFIMIANPDGFHYVAQTQDTFWVKNLSPVQQPDCLGVNLNRNFMYQWFPGLCGGMYDTVFPGNGPADQSETRAIQNLMLNYTLMPFSRLKVYLSLHSRGSNVLYPVCFHADQPENRRKVQKLAEEISDSLNGIKNYSYVANQCNHVTPGTGVNIDYAYGIGIPYPLIVNMPKEVDPDFASYMLEAFHKIATFLEEEYCLWTHRPEVTLRPPNIPTTHPPESLEPS